MCRATPGLQAAPYWSGPCESRTDAGSPLCSPGRKPDSAARRRPPFGPCRHCARISGRIPPGCSARRCRPSIRPRAGNARRWSGKSRCPVACTRPATTHRRYRTLPWPGCDTHNCGCRAPPAIGWQTDAQRIPAPMSERTRLSSPCMSCRPRARTRRCWFPGLGSHCGTPVPAAHSNRDRQRLAAWRMPTPLPASTSPPAWPRACTTR
ncbi:hypothetical protein D9X30_2253 [Cupriavidus sp. U2]|nr:hypothetical protein D9X30_2253 [Cupriavidus sp. U2]